MTIGTQRQFKITIAAIRYALKVFKVNSFTEFQQASNDEDKWFFGELTKAYEAGVNEADEVLKEKQ